MEKTADRNCYWLDSKSCDIVDSLAELRGPSSGMIELPVDVCWAPERRFNVGDADECRTAYAALLNHGSLEQITTFVNSARLIQLWNGLLVSHVTQKAWESRFRELVPWEQ